MKPRKLVILNQAANYLTVGFANAFNEAFDEVVLMTGSVHVQGEELHNDIKVQYINQWQERPSWKKALSYLLALWNMWWLLLFKYRKHEVFFVSVPPMGYLLNLVLPHRFSMVIWDVFPDTLKITGMSKSHIIYRVWSKLNRWSFKKAHRIFTISERMADLLEQYVDRKKLIIQPIWSIFQANKKVDKTKNPFIQEHQLEDYFIVQYSGNIGLSHRVEVMVELAEQMQDQPHILFQIIGRGPRKPHLEQLVKQKNLPNCQFLPFQSDSMFPYSLSAADIGVVILDPSTSKGSVPSKSYNLMSYGIPALYIASSDSQLQVYADTYGHAACFSEEELQKAKSYILALSRDRKKYEQCAQQAETASQDFRRDNADAFVEKYFAGR